MRKVATLKSEHANMWEEFLQLHEQRRQQACQHIPESGFAGYKQPTYPDFNGSPSNRRLGVFSQRPAAPTLELSEGEGASAALRWKRRKKQRRCGANAPTDSAYPPSSVELPDSRRLFCRPASPAPSSASEACRPYLQPRKPVVLSVPPVK
ncbi:hypothetical protein SASPL_129485 [Salvia splendens]|uniref:Uncharacterized protein n=1 Tax=Salvia splendens TaxID=180675 RepID=A0A8X8ZNR0_SALSN|nr:hypothetical protein SASPL_129485 [Salvia splendens]